MRTARWMAIVVVGVGSFASAKDIAVVSNKSNHMDAMTVAELVKVCKGQTGHWPDGKPVTVVIRDPGSPEMKLVLQKIYEVPKDDVVTLISTANHNRQNHPAIIVADSDDAVIKKVEGTAGAIGLVDVYGINGSVDVVHVGGKLPLEPGYLLHGN